MTSATPSREAFERWWESDEAFAHRHEETQEQVWAAWQARDAEIAELRKQLDRLSGTEVTGPGYV